MSRWPLLLLLFPSLAIGYNPSPSELLEKMEAGWRKVAPVTVRLRDYDSGGASLGEHAETAPGGAAGGRKDPDGFVPFARLLAGGDYLARALPTLVAGDASTGVARLDATVCYRLEGRAERLWLRKADLVPLKVETLLDDGVWAVTSYLGIVSVEDRFPFPSRTEFSRAGKLVLVETLVRDAPPASP